MSSQDVRVALHRLLRTVVDEVAPHQRCCVTCAHWNAMAEQCRKAHARPPAHVIAYGCPAYVWDEVPF